MDNKGNMSTGELQELTGVLEERIESLEEKLGNLDGGDSQAFWRISALENRTTYLTWGLAVVGAIVLYKLFIE